ncbi:hypothetical protein ACVITL_005129 [Rhizobium pisi]
MCDALPGVSALSLQSRVDLIQIKSGRAVSGYI